MYDVTFSKEQVMRNLIHALIPCTFIFLTTGGATLAASSPTHLDHPEAVALNAIPGGGFTYRQFPTNLPLYHYDGDKPGKSNCNEGCSSAWPPLLVSEASKRVVGDWTIVKRNDGREQWAYKGRPIYTRFHDSIDTPSGDGVDGPAGKWRLLEP
jgi:predicted lipoprotein with Yx(FWY)xxD motif